MLNGAGVLVNTAQEARGWFDTANPDIAYRGFFFVVEGAAQSFAGGGSVDVLFGVEARRLRVYNRPRLRCMKDERNNGKSASTTVA